MTTEELQALVARNAEAIASLQITVENQGRINTEAIESQGRINAEAIASLRDTAEVQLRTIESQRENIGSNAQMMADAMTMAAISQQTAAQSQETAAIALRMSAETTRNIDRLEQMMGIVIRDNQADRERIRRLENPE
jgi:hypothetical protein